MHHTEKIWRKTGGICRTAIRSLAVLAALSGGAQAFEQGSTAASLGVGAGRQFNNDYTILSVRAGYYFVREFEASIGLQSWRGGDPLFTRISPELRYVYTRMFRMKPYASLFFSRSFHTNGAPSRNTYGMKAGAYWTINPKAHLALDGVYERIENCDAAVYGTCSATYPELGLHFTF